jgi:hypothetical protein
MKGIAMPFDYTLSAFTEHLNTTFRIHVDDTHSVDAVLVEAVDVGSTDRQEQFSLVFRIPHSNPLPQLMYRMEHEHLGSLDLLIVPVGRDDQGLQYEAVFNLLR